MKFSLFYFAHAGQSSAADYELLLRGAQFADQAGLDAVWMPERHFHEFGGQYPNPAVTAAALAAVTSKVGLRAGSLVAPLHDPVRVAEEWAVVDRISGGRAGVSFASGWREQDFVLAQRPYRERREATERTLEEVRTLWSGGAVTRTDRSGAAVQVRTFPRPVQAELPVWLTSAGRPETFRTAGGLGANVLTHLLGQDLERLRANIATYRDGYRPHANSTRGGTVTVMLHTFLAADPMEARRRCAGPIQEYLRGSMDLWATGSSGEGADLSQLSNDDLDFVVERAADRLMDQAAAIGTVADVQGLLDGLAECGVDEIACLVDFGVEERAVLDALPLIADLVRRADTVRSGVSA
ncbi:MupA/Atu3671 family FMN-dependent luciferase-like monooxygenase [Streptomyces cyaneofuscatus]|uniref:MupA/Atu3671 family FMN-dependent luciferase-like monooxygenase n=1 Tax=Streptomyces cyaneofuscatus TaxID=66883 RepID=UPI0004C77A94|nr:MupA/Atu3671 family FMN-dependent luciferase-like monooxygenase [Streptomyces cyaneofuscatus]